MGWARRTRQGSNEVLVEGMPAILAEEIERKNTNSLETSTGGEKE